MECQKFYRYSETNRMSRRTKKKIGKKTKPTKKESRADAVSVRWESASSQISLSLSPYRNVALFCRVPVCVFSGKTLVVFKPNSRSQSLGLFSCKSVLTWSTFSCARARALAATTTSQQIQPVKFQCERRQKSRWKTTRQMLQLYPVLAAYMPHSLSAEREENTITRPMTPLVFRFLFIWLCPVVTRETEGKTKKFQKIKTGAILKRDDQVITLLFQCLLVGLFSQKEKQIVKRKSNQHFDVLKGA